MTGKLRKATEKDIPFIHKLVNQAAKSHRILPRSKEELKEVIDSFFIYETDGKIVGCCALEIYNKKIAEVRSLVVDNRYRKQGIGRLLIKACVNKAKKAKIRQVLSITDKVDFFRQCGFNTCLNDQYAMFIRPGLLKS